MEYKIAFGKFSVGIGNFFHEMSNVLLCELEIFDLEDNWYLMLLAMILNDRRINEYFEERNLDSIILGELEILINRDLSIIGGIRLIKEARQSWE